MSRESIPDRAILPGRRPWRLLRFRLSTLLLLIAVVSLALGWWWDHRNLTAELMARPARSPNWGVDQVTGPPNTTGSGDIRTAWASAGQDDQPEWLILEYNAPVTIRAVLIYETYNPGAVHKVSAISTAGVVGREDVLWEGVDPTPTTALQGISRIPIDRETTTDCIKVYLDSPAVPGWNEIDAVGLIDNQGQVHWARAAYASSSYGANRDFPQFTWRR